MNENQRFSFSSNAAEDVDRIWDAILTGSAEGLVQEGGSVAMEISRIHQADTSPAPDSEFTARLKERLFSASGEQDTVQSASQIEAAGAGEPAGISQPIGRPSRLPTPRTVKPLPQNRDPRVMRSWIALAAVSLVGLGIVASLVGGWSLGYFDRDGENPAPAVAPAVIEAPMGSSPEVVAQEEPEVEVQYRANAARTGVMPGDGPVGTAKLEWTNHPDDAYSLELVAAGDRIFTIWRSVQTDDAELVAISIESGEDLWSVPLDGVAGRFTALSISETDVIATLRIPGSAETRLSAFNQETGEESWSHNFEGDISGGVPAVANDMLFVYTTNSWIHALDAETGSELWRNLPPGLSSPQTFGDLGMAPLSVADDRIYGVYHQSAFALAADSGEDLWTADVGLDVYEPLVISDGAVLISGVAGLGVENPGRLVALDERLGTQLWDEISLSSGFSIATADGVAYTLGLPPRGIALSAYDIATGDLIWTSSQGSGYWAPSVAGERLFVSSDDGFLNGIDRQTGEIVWQAFVGWQASQIVVDDALIAALGARVVSIVGDGEPTSQSVADFSGFPACEAPRDPPSEQLFGDPAFTIAAESRLEPRDPPFSQDGRSIPRTEFPQILEENVPTGQQLTPSVLAEVTEVIDKFEACDLYPDQDQRTLGFYTDDFYRRGIVPFESGGYEPFHMPPEAGAYSAWYAIELEDRRVAAFNDNVRSGQYMLIFRKIDGQWLIDEAYAIVPEYNFAPMG